MCNFGIKEWPLTWISIQVILIPIEYLSLQVVPYALEIIKLQSKDNTVIMSMKTFYKQN